VVRLTRNRPPESDVERSATLLTCLSRVHELSLEPTTGEFIDGSIAADEMSVRVYWYGSVPASVRALVAEAAELGVTISVLPAAFSSQELTAVKRQIMDRAPALDIGLLLRLPDGSGFSVRFRSEQSRDVAIAALGGVGEDRSASVDTGCDADFDVLRSHSHEPTIKIDTAIDWFELL